MHIRLHPSYFLVAVSTWLALAGCGATEPPQADTVTNQPAVSSAQVPDAHYVGSNACGECHAAQWQDWHGSHHDLALQAADPDSILADFEGTAFQGASFERFEDEFTITPGAGSEKRRVLYTFGVAPLQQYVIPSDHGALQTFPLAWDSRSAADGGEKWFDLLEGDYPAGDPMHWTGRANSWNSQCADCHSTAVEKRYDSENRTYATIFAVEDVGCEACHGPGSRHVEDPETARPLVLTSQTEQINACAPCHSRRSQIAEGFQPGRSYFDHYAPRLLSSNLYYVDGQIDEEVYVYGSFLQSRMHRAGVTCTDCHEPHSASLKRTGNETCTFCHQPAPATRFAPLSAGNYDSKDHHLHEPDSPGSQCVSCHMPSRTYMGVDGRRDHSFRIPRPDLALALAVPDACTSCHQERTTEWASQIITQRFGESRPEHFAAAFAAADVAEPGADAALAALVSDAGQPIMVRASALERLGSYARGYTLDAVRLARKGEPLLRFAAPLAVNSLAAESRWRLLAPLLDDELRAVRHHAISALLPTVTEDPAYRTRLAPHVEVWLDEQKLNLDQPETLTNIAGAQMALGDVASAEANLKEALRLQSSWVPGLMNLSDLYRATGRDAEAGAMLKEALAVAPAYPEVNYGYALWLSRQGQLDDSLEYFARAAAMAPMRMQFGYAWAVALNDSGDGERAVAVLAELLGRWPSNQQLLLAAVTMLRDQGRFAETLTLLDRLLQLRPGDRELHQFREAMARAAAAA